MDFLTLFQISLFFLSGLYFYLVLPACIYLGLRQLIKEAKKKE